MAAKKKVKERYADIPPWPKKYRSKKKKPKEIAVVDEANCTGCEACVPFCPVDCIEHLPAGTYPDVTIQPVQIRFDECIGCEICVRVCEKMAWNAIEMHPTEEFEATFDIEIGEKFIPPKDQPRVAPGVG